MLMQVIPINMPKKGMLLERRMQRKHLNASLRFVYHNINIILRNCEILWPCFSGPDSTIPWLAWNHQVLLPTFHVAVSSTTGRIKFNQQWARKWHTAMIPVLENLLKSDYRYLNLMRKTSQILNIQYMNYRIAWMMYNYHTLLLTGWHGYDLIHIPKKTRDAETALKPDFSM